MKTKLTLILFCILFALSAQAGEIVLRGVYQGKNLYVQNPFAPDKSKYCTLSVFVNDKKILESPKTSSYEIDLSYLKVNDPIVIRIVHVEGCKPKVINASAIQPSATFQFTNFNVEETLIRWSAQGESANSSYYVEKFVNNNWLTIKTVTSNQGSQSGLYAIPVKHTAGVNKYRVKHQERDGKIFYTPTKDFNSSTVQVKFYPKNVTSKIYLTAEANYEILDANGKSVKKGRGKEIDASSLRRGIYYLNIDGRTEKFLKK